MAINVLVLSQSVVDGTILSKALALDREFRVSFIELNEQALLKYAEGKNHVDVIIVLQRKNDKEFAQKVRFIYNLFACPIVLPGSEKIAIEAPDQIRLYQALDLTPTATRFKEQIAEFGAFLKRLNQKHTTVQGADLPSINESSGAIGNQYEVIAVGASTGGPQALNRVFSALPAEMPVPILVVQHMPENFLPVLVGWLAENGKLNFTIASNGQVLKPGHVYFAPDNFHMVVNENKRIELVDAPPMHNVKPAASYLFRSVAEVYGERAIGILLTGMGKDGARELKLMKEKGALTIAQDRESSVVFGMPGEAVKLKAARLVLPPERIAIKLKEIFFNKKNGGI